MLTARSRQEVLLAGKPLESGTINLRGVVIRCAYLVCEHPVNSMGYGVSLYVSLLSLSHHRKEFDYLLKFPAKGEKGKRLSTNSHAAVTQISVTSPLPQLNVRVNMNGTRLNLTDGER